MSKTPTAFPEPEMTTMVADNRAKLPKTNANITYPDNNNIN